MSRPLRVLHIAPHLGGGVGKAHSTLAEAAASLAAPPVDHVYALLEEPRDIAYVERVRAAGCPLYVAPALGLLEELALSADIVQIEWWNHPRLYSLLASNFLPEMRLLIWLHVSGLSTPLIPPPLVALADKCLFTAACSFQAKNLSRALAGRPQAFGLASSGFGLENLAPRPPAAGGPLRLGYLGTLDFVKMNPRFFDLIDGLASDVVVRLWGRLDDNGEVAARAAAMRRPGRIRFEGFVNDPAPALGDLDVFLYLLAPGHYGTAENALVEAISAGAAPIVLNHPAEASIVKSGVTGIVIDSEAEFAPAIERLIRDPSGLAAMRAAGAADIADRFSPRRTLAEFAAAHALAMESPKRRRDFAAALGLNARDWFLASLSEDDDVLRASRMMGDRPSKGSLGHFRACLPQDDSLATLLRAQG